MLRQVTRMWATLGPEVRWADELGATGRAWPSEVVGYVRHVRCRRGMRRHAACLIVAQGLCAMTPGLKCVVVAVV